MTERNDSDQPQRDSLTNEHRNSEEVELRKGGRDFLLAFYAALKNLRLYPVENVQVQRALDEVHSLAEVLLKLDP